jgi:outer membrane protein OmpA-like peptidoglycan-associated protein
MESTMNKIKSVSMTLLAVALLAGCNTSKHNASLDDAHNRYNSASASPDVAKLAALELRDASDSLGKADQALSKNEDPAKVDHLAYLASQKVSIAEETAKQKAAELAVANANVQRTQTSLDARTAEADAAKRQVESMKKTAEEQEADRKLIAEQQAADLAAANANSASKNALIAKQASELKELNAQQTKRGLVITLGDVLFGINKSQLKSGGMRNVKKLADFLKEYPQHNALIEGYTDSTGRAKHNQRLSEQRAAAVKTELVDAGIGSKRITTRGYGEEFPVAGNDTATSRQLNRRVEVIISDENGNFASR